MKHKKELKNRRNIFNRSSQRGRDEIRRSMISFLLDAALVLKIENIIAVIKLV